MADVRRTELAALADIHLQMLPGTDVALYNAMLNHIIAEGLEDREFIATRTNDFEQVRDGGRSRTRSEMAAKITGIPGGQIRARGRDVRPRTAHLDALGHGAHPAHHRHRHRREPAQPDALAAA